MSRPQETSALGRGTHLPFKRRVITLPGATQAHVPRGPPLTLHPGTPHLTSPRPPASINTTHPPPAARGRGQGLSCVPMSQHGPPATRNTFPHPTCPNPSRSTACGQRCRAGLQPRGGTIARLTCLGCPACWKEPPPSHRLAEQQGEHLPHKILEPPGPHPVPSGPSGPKLHTSCDGALTTYRQAATALLWPVLQEPRGSMRLDEAPSLHGK